MNRQREIDLHPNLKIRTPENWKLVEALLAYKEAGFNPRELVEIAKQAGFDPNRSSRAIADYLNGETANLEEPARAALAAYWIESGQGQALLALRTATAPPFINVVGSLSTGFKHRPKSIDVDGTYYLYHGSYMRPKSFAIRVIRIQSVAGQLLTVEDYVRDLLHPANYGEILTASGVMTFEGNCPQILLRSDQGENKLGLSMILSDPIGFVGEKLNGFTGALLVLPGHGSVASRRCMLVRDETEDFETMKRQSGIFPISCVNSSESPPPEGATEEIEPIAEKHKERMRALAKEQFPIDPILWLAPWWKKKDSLESAPSV